MKQGDVDRLWIEFFVANTLDQGFRNIDVSRTLRKVITTGRPVRGMVGVFRRYLSIEGYLFAMDFVDDWLKLGKRKCLMKIMEEK